MKNLLYDLRVYNPYANGGWTTYTGDLIYVLSQLAAVPSRLAVKLSIAD